MIQHISVFVIKLIHFFEVIYLVGAEAIEQAALLPAQLRLGDKICKAVGLDDFNDIELCLEQLHCIFVPVKSTQH